MVLKDIVVVSAIADITTVIDRSCYWPSIRELEEQVWSKEYRGLMKRQKFRELAHVVRELTKARHDDLPADRLMKESKLAQIAAA